MTQSFLAHKRVERRFGSKSGIPSTEQEKIKAETNTAQRMTNILKKMHSPRNFAAPATFLQE